jgi:hypothetical protein
MACKGVITRKKKWWNFEGEIKRELEINNVVLARVKKILFVKELMLVKKRK